MDRLKLPREAATVKLDEYLVDDEIREGFLRPSTLSQDDSQPFDGRACNRITPVDFPKLIRALDQCNMLAAVRKPLGPAAGSFGVRKEWDEARHLWILRLVMDRRPRNAEERKLVPSEDTVPHGTCFTEILLEPGYVTRLWSTDLPQYYYRMAVSAERAESNTFTEAIDEARFKDTNAVQRLLEREGRAADTDLGEVCFALNTMAMEDVNATTFGQQGHVTFLRRFGATQPADMLLYRWSPPKGHVYEGVVIADHCVAAQVPKRRRWRRSAAARRALELHDAAQKAEGLY